MAFSTTTPLRRGLPAAAALGALGLAIAGGSAASAGGDAGSAQAEPAEIVMKLDGRSLRFQGPPTVVAGEELQIRNNTAPRRIGPHTFTLAREGRLPKGRRAIRRCFQRGRICRRIAVAHKVNLRTGDVGLPLFEIGAEGWDRSFSKTGRGDSWFAENKGETISQPVSAPAGTTLRFVCAIHPAMQGKIEVVEGAAAPTP